MRTTAARVLVASLFVAFLGGLAPAQPLSSHKELRYPPLKPVKIPDVVTATLSNGMKVYLMENHELPLVNGFALVRTGNLFDPPDKIGLASLTGAVMRTGGTRDKTGDELDEELENMAASVESSIGESSGRVSFSALRENTDQVLAVFRDVLATPEFRREKLDLAKTQLRSSISRRNDEASGIASREFSEIIYGKDSPYGWRIEYEHIDRVEREDLIEFHQRYFFPANVMLAVYGDFRAEEMKEKLEKLLGGWAAKQAPVPAFPAVRAAPAPGMYLAAKDDVTQTFFRLGHLGGELRDPNYPALEVMSDILGGGFQSRLFRKVRTELGYAYSISASWSPEYNHPGSFVAGGSTKSLSTVDTLRVIQEEIERIRTAEVTDDELKSAKDKVLNSFVFNFDTPGKTLSRLVTTDYHGYPKDFLFQYQKGVAAVTKADILRVAKQYLKPEAMTIVAVGKPGDFGKPLSGLGMKVHPIDLTIPEAKREAAKADATSLEKGHQLLERLQQAAGGAEKLAALKDSTIVSTAEIQTGGGAIKVRKTDRWVSPSHMRQDQELPFGKVTGYFDGKGGWLAAPQGVMPLQGPMLEQQQGAAFRNFTALWLSDRDAARTVNLAAENTLEISDKQGNVTRLVIDPATGLAAKQVYRSTGLRGAPSDVEEIYLDWREVDGIKMPFKIELHQGGGTNIVVNVEEIRLNTGLTSEELSRRP